MNKIRLSIVLIAFLACDAIIPRASAEIMDHTVGLFEAIDRVMQSSDEARNEFRSLGKVSSDLYVNGKETVARGFKFASNVSEVTKRVGFHEDGGVVLPVDAGVRATRSVYKTCASAQRSQQDVQEIIAILTVLATILPELHDASVDVAAELRGLFNDLSSLCKGVCAPLQTACTKVSQAAGWIQGFGERIKSQFLTAKDSFKDWWSKPGIGAQLTELLAQAKVAVMPWAKSGARVVVASGILHAKGTISGIADPIASSVSAASRAVRPSICEYAYTAGNWCFGGLFGLGRSVARNVSGFAQGRNPFISIGENPGDIIINPLDRGAEDAGIVSGVESLPGGAGLVSRLISLRESVNGLADHSRDEEMELAGARELVAGAAIRVEDVLSNFSEEEARQSPAEEMLSSLASLAVTQALGHEVKSSGDMQHGLTALTTPLKSAVMARGAVVAANLLTPGAAVDGTLGAVSTALRSGSGVIGQAKSVANSANFFSRSASWVGTWFKSPSVRAAAAA